MPSQPVVGVPPARGIPRSVSEFRERYRATEISPRYSGIAHFCFTSSVALAVVVSCLFALDHVAVIEWLTVPLTFLLANVIEYYGHRGPMHRPMRFLRALHKRHTLEHHRFYTHDAMPADSSRDFKMVLFPPIMIFFFIGLHGLPLALVLYGLVSKNVAALFLAMAVGYFLLYEWLHFSYHMPKGSWVARVPFMKRLAQHHTVHHNLALMSRYNFNITFPISDAVFGTAYREESLRS